jgi:hypothetical protein
MIFILPFILRSFTSNILLNLLNPSFFVSKHSQNNNFRNPNSDNKAIEKYVKDEYGRESIFIADTLDNVILRYELQIDPKKSVLDSRDILSDMRKVLKLSRIG